MYAFITVNFCFSNVLAVFHKFWYFLFIFFYENIFFDSLLFPPTQWLFKRMLLSFHVFYNFLVFLLLVVSSFLSLSSEKILRMMLIFSNLLKFVLWLNMWSFLEIVMSVLEKNAFFCCWREFCICLLDLCGQRCCSDQLFPYWLSGFLSPVFSAGYESCL